MSDYIEREAAQSAVWEEDNQTDMILAIGSLPAADVAPVRHGRWIKPVPGDGENYCSVCKAEQLWFYGYGYLESNYCPNCGARMEKEDEHEAG